MKYLILEVTNVMIRTVVNLNKWTNVDFLLFQCNEYYIVGLSIYSMCIYIYSIQYTNFIYV